MDKRGVITFLDYKVNRIEFRNNDDYDGEEADIDFDVLAKFNISDDSGLKHKYFRTEKRKSVSF